MGGSGFGSPTAEAMGHPGKKELSVVSRQLLVTEQ